MTIGISPTQMAKMHLDKALQGAIVASQGFNVGKDVNTISHYNVTVCLANLVRGLQDLTLGLRATYMLLEQIDAKLSPPAKGGARLKP